MLKYIQSLAIIFSVALASVQLVIRNSADPDERSVDVRVTAPTGLPTYNAGTSSTLTSLAGTAASNATITGCTWTNSLGGSGSATGTTSWSVASISLTVGDNLITVTCTNNSGRSYIDTLLVTRSSSSFPDASNTGVPDGTSLTAYTGPSTITVDDTIIDSKTITNTCLLINADNVIIRKSRIEDNTGCIWVIDNGASESGNGINLLIEDSEIKCSGAIGKTAISNANYTLRRVEVRDCENLATASGGSANVTIEDSFLHDPICYGAGDPHIDGVQIFTSTTNVTINHNTIYGTCDEDTGDGNSAVTMGSSTSNIAVTNNLLAGGGYTLYCNHLGAQATNTYTNNRFSNIFSSIIGTYGPSAECEDEPNFTGNVCHETGLALSTCGG